MGKSRKRRRSSTGNWFNDHGKYIGLAAVGAVAAGLVAFALAPTPTTDAPTSTPEAVASEAPAAETPTAVFIGDSYAQGTGATSADKKWTSVLATQFALTQTNLGRGGTGYVTTSGVNGCGLDYCPTFFEMIPEAVEAAPDVVFVSGGQNDLPAWTQDADEVRASILVTYQTIRAELPNALIVGVGPSIPGESNAAVEDIDAAVQAAVTAVSGVYVSLLEPSVIEQSMVLPDGAHVDDSGHAAIAARIAPGIESQVAALVG